MEFIQSHWGSFITTVLALLGGAGYLFSLLQKSEEQAVEEIIGKIIDNPKLHPIVVKYKPQIKSILETAEQAAEKKIDEAQ